MEIIINGIKGKKVKGKIPENKAMKLGTKAMKIAGKKPKIKVETKRTVFTIIPVINWFFHIFSCLFFYILYDKFF